METLKISKENALKTFESATKKQQKLLIGLFGKNVFKKSGVERISSYEDACDDLDLEPLKISAFSFLPEVDRKHAFASHKLTVIIKALNEGWEPNWTDSNESKYYAWFKNSGSGFSFLGYYYDFSYSHVGARLHFKSRELTEYAAKQFINEFNDYLSL